ncbi:hypothetical protein CRYUN_Cryun10bG0119600 [Craigia yunnanensis]
MNVIQHPMNKQNQTSADGPVGILWDIENCPVPSDVRPEDVAGNIRMALRVHPETQRGLPENWCQTHRCPKWKDAADKAILVDMFLFALDNPPPSSIMLISGDVDFAPSLHILGQRGYTVILVIPSGVGVSSALSNAGKFVWDWPSVARGEGFVPPSKVLIPPRGGTADISGYFMGCHISDNPDGQHEEKSIVYRGISQSYYNSRDFSIVSQSLSEYTSNPSIAMPSFPTTLRSQSLPSGLNEASGCPGFYDQNDTMFVQPGDINGLKGQLSMGAFKLVNLLKRWVDTLAIDGKSRKKFVYLRNWKAGPRAPPLVLARKDKKGKGNQEESMDVAAGAGSSDEFSDEERVVVEEHDERRNEGRTNFGAAGCDVHNQIYQQRYKKPLDYRKIGVEKLEELFDKVRDVVVLHEEPASKRKFLCVIDG